jgi:hypothetical protein
MFYKVFRRLYGLPTRSVGPTNRSASLLVGRTHLSETAVSLVGGDPGVAVSHTPKQLGYHRPALGEKNLSTLHISNSLLNKNPLNLPYHALGACFSPYKAFLSLYTRWGNSATQVVASHKLPPLKTHLGRRSSHPFLQPESFSHRKG